MTFKEKEQLLHFLFNKRNRILMLSNQVKDSDEKHNKDDEFLWCMQYALQNCRKDYQEILIREFILHESKDWWYDYYSRSTYYRMKHRAMDAFLDCLHQ